MKISRNHIVNSIAAAALSLSVGLATQFAQAEPIQLPDFGDSAGGVISPTQEKMIGAAFLRQMRSTARVVDDPEIDAYINDIGKRIGQHSDYHDNFTFFMVADNSINAFAAPGGYIGAHTGLILNASTESEVAAVIAHEVAHVSQRHLARSFERASQMSLPVAAAMIGAILLGSQNGEAGIAALSAVQAGAVQDQINFTRSNEKEADRIGIQFMVDAGYNPVSMPAFFSRLQRANRYTDTGSLPEFLRTHPVTIDRIGDSQNRAESYPLREYKEGLEFFLIQARIQVMSMSEPRDAVQFYEEQLRTGQYKNEAGARYGYALALLRMKEFGKARLQLSRLIAEDDRLTYRLALANMEAAQNNLDQALELYADLQKDFGDHRAIILYHARALLSAGKIEQARQLLREFSYRNQTGPAYYKLLAEAEGRSGKEIESHITLSEYYYSNGEVELAIRQLKLAEGQAKLDYYQRERISARLKELNKELEERRKMGLS